jgi:hypothetical protein
LLALAAQSAVDQLDEVIVLFDQAVSARESRAKARTDEALAERAGKGEARQLLMDVILPVLIDVGVPDENVGEMLRTRNCYWDPYRDPLNGRGRGGRPRRRRQRPPPIAVPWLRLLITARYGGRLS